MHKLHWEMWVVGGGWWVVGGGWSLGVRIPPPTEWRFLDAVSFRSVSKPKSAFGGKLGGELCVVLA